MFSDEGGLEADAATSRRNSRILAFLARAAEDEGAAFFFLSFLPAAGAAARVGVRDPAPALVDGLTEPAFPAERDVAAFFFVVAAVVRGLVARALEAGFFFFLAAGEAAFVPAFLALFFTEAARVRPAAADPGLRAAGREVPDVRDDEVRVVLLALRLAMIESFRNLDSLAISVVLSDAYRKSEGCPGAPADRNCGPPDPATRTPAIVRVCHGCSGPAV